MRLNGVTPEVSCEVAFERDEWRIIYAAALQKKPPKQVPTLREMIHLVASYGGFLGRKGDGEPGIKTLWQGLERCNDIVNSIQAVREFVG